MRRRKLLFDWMMNAPIRRTGPIKCSVTIEMSKDRWVIVITSLGWHRSSMVGSECVVSICGIAPNYERLECSKDKTSMTLSWSLSFYFWFCRAFTTCVPIMTTECCFLLRSVVTISSYNIVTVLWHFIVTVPCLILYCDCVLWYLSLVVSVDFCDCILSHYTVIVGCVTFYWYCIALQLEHSEDTLRLREKEIQSLRKQLDGTNIELAELTQSKDDQIRSGRGGVYAIHRVTGNGFYCLLALFSEETVGPCAP